ncbi:hypothetical protein KR222_005939, partial [Zaprionus bogoriensis]
SKSELKHEFSQASISSDDKAIQFPSETELEELMESGKQVYRNRLDQATDTIEFDNEHEDILHIPLTPCSDRKKDIGSPNSSYNSRRSEDRSSSISSITSYEPSVRFFRRTHAEDDEDSALLKDQDDAGPTSYKQHVARLAERALRKCTNYYDDNAKSNPEPETKEPNFEIQLLYCPEKQFNATKRQRKNNADDLGQQFNGRYQPKLIAPRFQ